MALSGKPICTLIRAPAGIKENKVNYKIKIAPQKAYTINCTSVFSVQVTTPVQLQFESYSTAFNKIKTGMEKSREMVAEIFTDNEQFNNWIKPFEKRPVVVAGANTLWQLSLCRCALVQYRIWP